MRCRVRDEISHFREGGHDVERVSRTPTHTACMYRCAQCVSASHCTSREHVWLKFKDLCTKNIPSSTRHVSFLAALDTDHKHKFSFTYLSNLTVILSYTPKPVVPRSICTLRRFTAESRFLRSPVSHRL